MIFASDHPHPALRTVRDRTPHYFRTLKKGKIHVKKHIFFRDETTFSFTIIDNTKLNSTYCDCDLIFSGSITLTGYMIWDLLIGITW